MKSFGSDNHSGIAPEIIEAIALANVQHVEAYGDDEYTLKAQEMLKEKFGCIDSYFVFNGTGANIFALKCMSESFHTIICASTAHINVDECGAPENFTSCKLTAVATPDGKLTCELVKPYLTNFGNKHHSQPGVISISQPTELGTLYTPKEIDALGELAHSYGMKLHVDGARFANAVAALGCDPKEMLANVDVLSLGGTKNGLMIGEAVLFFDKESAKHAIYYQKRAMQLYSKTRFIAAQFLAYINQGIWLKNSSHANKMAQYMASELAKIDGVEITQSVDTNGVFAKMDKNDIEELSKRYLFYVWDEQEMVIRLMTSFDTTQEDVDSLIADVKDITTKG